MGRRRKQEAKLDLEDMEEAEMLPQSKSGAAAASSDDDEEANEDLSLKIVEKALLMRAAKLAPAPFNGVVSDDDDTDDVGGVGAVALQRGKALVEEMEISREKRTVKKDETQQQVAISLEREEEEQEEEKEEAAEARNDVESIDPNPVEMADNMVLRKLLRGPRYFDPPGNSLQTCYNCGGEGHAAANCSQKRKRPCFFCGSLEHKSKDCRKEKCFACNSDGHKAKDCPEKKKQGSHTNKICLKCGMSGHKMFRCENDYSPEDLKEIQCYICQNFGHLCCVNSVDNDRSEISCYKCGLLGHTGSACGRARIGNQVEATLTSCYKCGEEGHFARECTSSYKVSTSFHEGTQGEATPNLCYKCGQEGHFARECTVSTKFKYGLQERSQGDATPSSCYNCGQEGHFARECYYTNKWSTSLRNGPQDEATPSSYYKCGQVGHFVRECNQLRKRNQEPSTPFIRSSDQGRDYLGLNSPSNSKKSSKRKKKNDIDGSTSKSQRKKQRGGWVTKELESPKFKNSAKNNGWASPATQSNGTGRNFYSPSPRRPQKYQYGDSSQPGYSASRFSNSRSDSTRRNYDWW